MRRGQARADRLKIQVSVRIGNMPSFFEHLLAWKRVGYPYTARAPRIVEDALF